MPRPSACLAALAVALLPLLAGCTQPEPAAQPAPAPADPKAPPQPILAPPPNSLAGEWLKSLPGPEAKGCFAEQTRPAVVETVTEHVLVEAEERDPRTGTVTTPASYRTTSQARIVAGGEKMWFATVCPRDLTPTRITTLQRALQVRGLYAGPVNGRIDAATREAIRRYQSQRGLISDTLSLRAAREIGLVSWLERPPKAPEPAAKP